MLNTIRAKFAAVLLAGLVLTILALSKGVSSGFGEPALIASSLMLVVMLLVERIVINPITRLTRDVVLIAKGDPSDPMNRLAVKGPEEVATLARTFNVFIAHLGARQELEQRLEHMAHHDALTNLPNRLRLRQAMESELARVQRGESVAVLCLDLDHFKSVNDTLGHPVGDRLLEAVAERLRQNVRDVDIVARVGGDEFAIVQVAAEQPRGAIILADRLIETLAKPFDLDGHQVVIGTSIGIALAPLDGLDTDQLIKNADMALYRAKADGRGVFRFFEPEMDAKMQARRTLEIDLRKALAEGEFELFYQPLVNLASNEVSGFEALLRWNHPTRGLVPPSEFIPIAEEMGLIVPLGERILRQACAEAAGWPDDIKVAVNLSPVQFKSKTLALAVTSALASSGLPPHRLELEITESVLLQDNEATLTTLHQLRQLGVRISMDDFGTGYSSLSYLRSFPFDKIKIDQSFVRDLSGKEDSLAIIRAVAGLGRNLGMATTAEGVETREQLGYLRQEGCTEVQGYLFSRPLPARNIIPLLESVRKELRPAA
jgi:diguanylate cyclase (GGDEF)-like protein